MKLIKLSAIDSTNLYLKKIASKSPCENYTVVQAEFQENGRGQMGTVWSSEYGKNLTFSTLILFDNFKIEDQFYLSMAVSLGVLKVLKQHLSQKLSIKWPNDILAEGDKVAGILIENMLSSNLIKKSVIGIGLNVNQTNFPVEIPYVTSLKKLSGTDFNIEDLLEEIIASIQKQVSKVTNKYYKELKEDYLNELYKFKVPAMFVDKNEKLFMGKIIDVNRAGQLVVEDENEKVRNFSLKEIKFADRNN